MYTRTGACVHICMQMHRRIIARRQPREPAVLFICGTGSLIGRELTLQARLASQEVPEIYMSLLPESWDHRSILSRPTIFFIGFRGPAKVISEHTCHQCAISLGLWRNPFPTPSTFFIFTSSHFHKANVFLFRS